MSKRTCWECKHLIENMQSDMTPGYNSTIECAKKHFGQILAADADATPEEKAKDDEAWEDAIKMAEDCKDYEKRP